MKILNLTLAAALALSLSGCLEVDQRPTAANRDKPAQQTALAERTKTQNEYNRVKP